MSSAVPPPTTGYYSSPPGGALLHRTRRRVGRRVLPLALRGRRPGSVSVFTSARSCRGRARGRPLRRRQPARHAAHARGGASCGAPRPRFVMAPAGATLGAGAPTDFVGANDVVRRDARDAAHDLRDDEGAPSCWSPTTRAAARRRPRLPPPLRRRPRRRAQRRHHLALLLRVRGCRWRAHHPPVAADVRHAVTSGRRSPPSSRCTTRRRPRPTPSSASTAPSSPSIAVTLADLEAANAGSSRPSATARWERPTRPTAPSAAVASFPRGSTAPRARARHPRDLSAESIVREYAEDFPAAPPRTSGCRRCRRRRRGRGPSRRRSARCARDGGGSGIGQAVAVRLAEGAGRTLRASP